MYYNPEDTPLYISEYSLLAFGDKHFITYVNILGFHNFDCVSG